MERRKQKKQLRDRGRRSAGVPASATSPSPTTLPPWKRTGFERGVFVYQCLAGLLLAVFFLWYCSRTIGHVSPIAKNMKWNGLAWMFMTGIGLIFWTTVPLIILPAIARSILVALQRLPSTAWKIGFVVLGLVVLVISPVRNEPRPGWKVTKTFDDIMAISNASLMHDTGFNTDMLYFRSMLRPGFVCYVMPAVVFSPLQIKEVTKSPSDNYRKVWRIYADPGKKEQIFPYVSRMVSPLLVLMTAMAFAMFIRLKVHPIAALAGVAGLDWFWLRSIEVVVTQGFVLFCSFYMVAVYLAREESEKSIWDYVLAGLAVAACGLTMNTLIIPAVAIAAYQVMLWFTHGRTRTYLIRCAAMWGVAGLLIIIWYQGFLNGLITELKQFNLEVKETQELMKFTPLSWSEFARIGTMIFGWMYIPALVGLVVLPFYRKRIEGKTLMLTWLVMSLILIPTVPFIFARFLMYAIGPVCFLIALPFHALLQRWHRVESPGNQV